MAFLRVCFGQVRARHEGVARAHRAGVIRLANPTQFMAQERTIVEEGFAGDVLGTSTTPGIFEIGDTSKRRAAASSCSTRSPTFAPEHFVTVRNRDATRHKQFHRGLEQLAEEGVVHLLRRDPGADPAPVLAAVGPLQFEVAVARLEHEFGVDGRPRPDELDARPPHRQGGRGGPARRAATPTSCTAATARSWRSSRATSCSTASRACTPTCCSSGC